MRKLLRGRRRAWLALPVVLLVAAASSGAWLLTRDSSEAAASTTATVSTQTMQETVSADGTLAARRTRDESFAVSGTVTRVAVSAGDRVAKGDVLATVGSDALLAARTAAVASLNASVAQLDDDEDAGASDVQIAADQAAIVSARASLSDARQAVDDATLRATIPGTVTAVGVSRGDVVGSDTGATGDTTSTADFTIVSTNEYVVDATVAAEDVDQLKKGMQAQVTATGVTDTIYGTVKTVGLVAQTNDSGAAVFPVTIEVTGKQKDLFAGVSATVSVIVKETPDVLTVVSRALTTEDDTTYVTVVVDGDEVKTEVKTGQTYGMTTEITSGLKDGDVVVIPGFTAPTGSGNTGENGFPGGGELPDFSQMGGSNGFPAGGPPQ
ncbi:efflux RND transporter periplasmic adaptor subunit [Nocardioides sp. CN2-186]|uniref:efflux RND transporter periplasmic adaptor subunit n=1 Tax=Nocardioides tweenelious TaxID=3156607 RepID=UPI0032B4AE4C